MASLRRNMSSWTKVGKHDQAWFLATPAYTERLHDSCNVTRGQCSWAWHRLCSPHAKICWGAGCPVREHTMLSISMVPITEEWHWLRASTRFSADVLFCVTVSLSSTNRQIMWVSCLPAPIFLQCYTNTLASKGPSGDPIATPSVCSCSWPLKITSWSLVVALRRSTRSCLLRWSWYV